MWNCLKWVRSFSEGFILIGFVDFEFLVDFGLVDFLLQVLENVVLYENPDFFVNLGKYGLGGPIWAILAILSI